MAPALACPLEVKRRYRAWHWNSQNWYGFSDFAMISASGSSAASTKVVTDRKVISFHAPDVVGIRRQVLFTCHAVMKMQEERLSSGSSHKFWSVSWPVGGGGVQWSQSLLWVCAHRRLIYDHVQKGLKRKCHKSVANMGWATVYTSTDSLTVHWAELPGLELVCHHTKWAAFALQCTVGNPSLPSRVVCVTATDPPHLDIASQAQLTG